MEVLGKKVKVLLGHLVKGFDRLESEKAEGVDLSRKEKLRKQRRKVRFDDLIEPI